MTSKYIAYFYDEISTWQKRLSQVDQIISLWMDVQRTWSHLESIFIGSDDIRKQLPVDSERFDDIDKEFKELMVKMAKTPNVVKVNIWTYISCWMHMDPNIILCPRNIRNINKLKTYCRQQTLVDLLQSWKPSSHNWLSVKRH